MQEPAEHHVVRVQRPAGVVPDAPHGGAVKRLVLEAVQVQYLVVGEVERALHAAPAPRGVVARVIPAARLAPDEVRHQRPPLAAGTRRRIAPHLLLPVHDPRPEAVQAVRAPDDVRTVQFDTILNESPVIIIQMRVNTYMLAGERATCYPTSRDTNNRHVIHLK